MPGPTKTGLGTAYIVKGVIQTVDRAQHTASVAIDAMNSVTTDVQIASMYCHPYGGEGGYVMPEPGASCHITYPSDGSRPFVSSFVMPPTDVDGDAGGREELNPGGFVFTTRDGNFIRLLRGGVVEIGSNSLCQRTYVPVMNYIRDIFQNYQMVGIPGSLSWTVDASLEGMSKTRYQLHLLENAEDITPRVLVEVGEFLDEPDLMYEGLEEAYLNGQSYIRVLLKDEIQREVATIRISKDGKITLTTADYFFAKIGTSLRIEFGLSFELKGPLGSEFVIDPTGATTQKMTSWDVTSFSDILMQASSVSISALDIKMGAGATQSLVRGEVAYAWLQAFAQAVAIQLPEVEPFAILPPLSTFVSTGVKVP